MFYSTRVALATCVLLSVLGGCSSAEIEAPPSAIFENCEQLNLEYLGGIGQSNAQNKGSLPLFEWVVDDALYDQFKDLDEDQDGIACELTKLTPQLKAKHFGESEEAVTDPVYFGLSKGVDDQGFLENVDAIPVVPYMFVEGEECDGAMHDTPIPGYLEDGTVAYLECYQLSRFRRSPDAFEIDQETLKPLIPVAVPEFSTFSYSPYVYIQPQVSQVQPSSGLSNPSAFDDVEPCRLREADVSWPGRPHMVSGFPMVSERAIMDDRVVIQVIPVDFADYRSASNPSNDIFDATDAVAKFWSRMSDGRTNFEVRIPDEYFNLPDEVASYELGDAFPNFNGQAYADYIAEAVDLSDSAIDFSDVDVVVLAHSPATPGNLVATFIAEAGMRGSNLIAYTDEKVVYNFMVHGGDWPRNIPNWIHEFGHMLGLTDSGFTGNMGFDIMLHYGVPELTVWNRFVLGVEKDSQIHCKTDAEETTHLLAPVAWPGDQVEGLVIPLSDTKAIVVESRRRTGYDVLLGQESEGAFVYEVDTSRSGNQGDGPFTSLAPGDVVGGGWVLNSPLKQGESVEHAGWVITNIESGEFGDVVRVSPASQ